MIDDELGDAVRVTVIAAGFEPFDDGGYGYVAREYDEGFGRGAQFGRGGENYGEAESFAAADDDLDLGDDEFDVPSFLR